MQNFLYYSIHNLVTVRVDQSVRPWVLKSVNQQIGAFQSTVEQRSNLLLITIQPFDLFVPESVSDTFQKVEGSEVWYRDGEVRLAIRRTEKGYNVYTDSMVSLLGLLQELFLRQNISFVHAAALQDPKGEVVLLAGAGGVGKTALSGFLVRERGYRLLGDDMVLLAESGSCLAFPRPFTLKEYHRSVYPEVFAKRKTMGLQRRLIRSVVWQLYSNAPFRGLIDRVLKHQGIYNRIAFIPFIRSDYVDIVPVSEIFGAENLAAQGSVARTLFLTRSSDSDFSLKERDRIWMARRTFAILYEELQDDLKRLLQMGALGSEDAGAHLCRARAVLEKAISKSSCAALRIPRAATPEELIRAFDTMVLKQEKR